MGLVYRAFWKGVEVAVKKVPIDGVDEESRKAIEAEAALMSGLRHPNIILYMGTYATASDIAIITEYCSRGSLYHMLHSSVDLPLTRRRRFALDAARVCPSVLTPPGHAVFALVRPYHASQGFEER